MYRVSWGFIVSVSLAFCNYEIIAKSTLNQEAIIVTIIKIIIITIIIIIAVVVIIIKIIIIIIILVRDVFSTGEHSSSSCKSCH